MRVLSPDDVRAMVRTKAVEYGTYKQLAELHGIHPNHLSNFMRGWCGPPVLLLEALGVVQVYMLATDAPAGHDTGHVTTRRRDKGAAYEDPMS